MKKRILTIIFALLMIFSISGCSKSSKQKENNTPVEFSDFLVERCVRKKLGKDWDEDITVKDVESITSLTISSIYDPAFVLTRYTSRTVATYCGYIDLSDLKWLTNLKELKLQTLGMSDSIVNFDAITNCKKLEKLSMPWVDDCQYKCINPMGYKYWANIISELPELKYLDLGRYFNEHMMKFILSEIGDRNIEFYYGEKDDWYGTGTETYFYQALPASRMGLSIQCMEESTMERYTDYKAAWDDVINTRSKAWLSDEEYWNSEVFPVIYANDDTDLREQLKNLDKSIEDIIVVINDDYIHFNAFAEFDNLLTLTIMGKDLKTKIYPWGWEWLDCMDNLRVLNLCGCSGNFVDIRDIPNLRELSLIDCDIEHINFLGELNTVKELILTFNDENNSVELYESVNAEVCNLKNLKYYREYFFSDNYFNRRYDDIETFKNITSMESLETLVVYGNNDIENIVESTTLKYLYANDYNYCQNKDLYKDFSDVTFDKMKNLKQIMLDGYYKNINYDSIVGLPNITSVGYSESLTRYNIPEILTTDLANKIVSSNITSFGPTYLDSEENYVHLYEPHGPNKDYIRTLYEAGVDDRVAQHYISYNWRYGRKYTLEDFFERYGNGY